MHTWLVTCMYAHTYKSCTYMNTCIPTHMSVHTCDASNFYKGSKTGVCGRDNSLSCVAKEDLTEKVARVVDMSHHMKELVNCQQMKRPEEGVA